MSLLDKCNEVWEKLAAEGDMPMPKEEAPKKEPAKAEPKKEEKKEAPKPKAEKPEAPAPEAPAPAPAPAEEAPQEQPSSPGQIAAAEDLVTAEVLGTAIATAMSTLKQNAKKVKDLEGQNAMHAGAMDALAAQQPVEPTSMTDRLFPPKTPEAAQPAAPAAPGATPAPSQPAPVKTASPKEVLLKKLALELGHTGDVIRDEAEENLKRLGGGVAAVPTSIMGAMREAPEGAAAGGLIGSAMGLRKGMKGVKVPFTRGGGKLKFLSMLAGGLTGGIAGGAIGAAGGATYGALQSGMKGYEAGYKDMEEQYGRNSYKSEFDNE